MVLSSSRLDAWNIGALFLNDVSNNGRLRVNIAGLSASYTRALMKTRLRQLSLTAGAALSYNQTNVNTRDLWFGRQYDQTNLEIDRSIDSGEGGLNSNNDHLSLDGGINLSFQNKKLGIDFSTGIFHFNNPSLNATTEELISRRLTNRIKVSYKPGKTAEHTVFLRSIYQQPGHQLVGGYGISFSINEDETVLSTTSALRLTNGLEGYGVESAIVSFGVDFSGWGCYLSYDINVSDLNYQFRGTGALELGLSYYLEGKN